MIPLCCKDEKQSKTLENSFPSPHSILGSLCSGGAASTSISAFGKVTAFSVGSLIPLHFIPEPKYLENIPSFKNMYSWHVFLPGSLEIQPGFSHTGQCKRIMIQENLQQKSLGLSQHFFFSALEQSLLIYHIHSFPAWK